jgi:hypothetical protein
MIFAIPLVGAIGWYANELLKTYLKHKRQIEQMRIEEARRIEAREDRILGLSDVESGAALEIIMARLDALETRLDGPVSEDVEPEPRTMTETDTELA